MKMILKSVLLAVLVVALHGCGGMGFGVQNMTPQQIKATEGIATCTDAEVLYLGASGRGTTITANTDDTKKGQTSAGTTTITCGKASMTIQTNVGVQQQLPSGPPPAVTTETETTSKTKMIQKSPEPVPPLAPIGPAAKPLP